MRENRRAVRLRVGRNVMSLRRARGLSQEGLAELVDSSGKYIGQIERAMTNVSLDVLADIAAGLSVNVAELFGPVPASAARSRIYILSERDYQYVEQALRALKKAKYPGRWRE
jgi:transcriptional regulator with XRE-family HTH domain